MALAFYGNGGTKLCGNCNRDMRVSQMAVYTAIRCGYISIGMAFKNRLARVVNNC